MSITYTHLFKVMILHTYYMSNICECLQYRANSKTKIIQDKFGFVFKLLPDGFEFYTSSSQPIETYLNYITKVTGATAFEFEGITDYANFYNFTDIPINELGVLSYESDKSKTLSNDIIQLSETFVKDINNQKAITISVKFKDIISLKKSNSNIVFHVQMQARKTIWNYYIINNSHQEYDELTIQGSKEIQFTTPTETTLQNGQKALLFSSDSTKIPLKNEATHTFELVNTKKTISGDRKEIIIKGLPIANPQNLQIQNDHSIASLIYVYI